MSQTQPYGSRPRRSESRRRWLSIAVVIVIVVGLGAVLAFCAGQGGRRRGGYGGMGGRPAVTVGVAKAVLGDVPIEVDALGTVTPLATVSVNTRVSGQLESVDFREGQIVRKGQLLAQIDPRPFQASLDQDAGTLGRDAANLAGAERDLARYLRLAGEDSIARQTLEDQQATVKQLQSVVAADKAAVESARLNLEFSRIAAPISGRIGLREIDVGNQIAAGQSTPVAVITQMSPISVIFSVPEDDIGPIEKQGGAGLATTALDRAGGRTLAVGRLATLDNLIDTTTGTVKARADFANADGALFPNEFVSVSLLVTTLHNQVIVPTTAVRHGPKSDFVWLLQPDQTVTARNVTVGPGTPETVSIASGLAAGETVITDGGDRLKEGSRVVLPGQSPAPAAGRGKHGRGGGHGAWRGRHGGQGGQGGPPSGGG